MSEDVRQFPLPPWLWSGTEREPLRDALGRARWLLISYWVLLVSGYLALTATVLGLSTGSGSGYALVAAIAAASVVGVLVGNLLGLLRLRAWIVNLLAIGASITACLGTAVLGTVVAPILVTFF